MTLFIKKYSRVFLNSWQWQLEFRASLVVRFLISAISLVSIFYLWNDVYAGKTAIMGYTKADIVTYYILAGYFYSSIFAMIPIAEEIQTGQLSQILTKPMNYLWFHYFRSMAKRLFRLAIGFPIVLLLFVLLKDYVSLPTDPMNYLFLFLTLFGAINILYLFDVLIGCVEFWVFRSWTVSLLADSIVAFFSGTLIPLFLLPDYVERLGSFLPFRFTSFFMIDSFTSRAEVGLILQGIGKQALWTGVMVLLVLWVWRRGLIKYEAVGG